MGTTYTVVLWAIGSLATLGSGCGGGTSSSGSPAAANCGQVQPCGGPIVGTWKFQNECFNSTTGSSSSTGFNCAGATVSASDVQVSGTVTFNSDLTFAANTAMTTTTVKVSIPATCLTGGTCAQLGAALQLTSSEPGASAICTGTTTCDCTEMSPAPATMSAGTYSTSGSTITVTDNGDGGSPLGTNSSYCVQGNVLHLIQLNTMNMGSMGQAAIALDLVAQKQ